MKAPRIVKLINDKLQGLILKVVDTVYIPFEKIIPRQLFRYGVSGVANLVLDWVLYFVIFHYVVAKQVVHIFCFAFSPHIAAFLVQFPITFITGFWLQRYISFNDSVLRGRVQIIRYLFVVLTNILFITLLLKLFVDVCGFYPTPSKIVATLITTIYSYLMQKYYSFKS